MLYFDSFKMFINVSEYSEFLFKCIFLVGGRGGGGFSYNGGGGGGGGGSYGGNINASCIT